jgi:hypothetical protein
MLSRLKIMRQLSSVIILSLCTIIVVSTYIVCSLIALILFAILWIITGFTVLFSCIQKISNGLGSMIVNYK